MRKHYPIRSLLKLALLLVIGGNGWAYGLSEGWAQMDAPSTSNVAEQQAKGRIARSMLRQLEAAAAGLEDNGAKAYVLIAIAEGYIATADEATATEHLQQALILVDTLTDHAQKQDVLSELLSVVVELSDPGVVSDFIAQILVATGELQVNDDDKVELLSAIAWRAGYSLSEQHLVHQHLGQARAMANTLLDPNSKALALLDLNHVYANIEAPATAIDALPNTLMAIGQMDEHESQRQALVEAIQLLVKLSPETIDLSLLQPLLAIVDQMENQGDRARTLNVVALTIQPVAEDQMIQEILDQALTLATDIEQDQDQASALSKISVTYSLQENQPAPEIFLGHVLKAANDIQDSTAYYDVFHNVASAPMVASQSEAVRTMLEQAATKVTTLQNSWPKAAMFIQLADVYQQQTNEAMAQQFLIQAVETMEAMGPDSQFHTLMVYMPMYFVEIAGQLSNQIARQQLLEQLWAFANAMDDPDLRITLLTSVAEGYGTLQNQEKMTTTLDQIMAVNDLSPDGLATRQGINNLVSMLDVIDGFASELGEEKVRTELNQILSAVYASKARDIHPSFFWGIGRAVAVDSDGGRLLDQDTINAMVMSLSTIANQVEIPRQRVSAFHAIAQLHMSLNNPVAAEEYLRRALAEVNQIDNDDDRLYFLRSVLPVGSSLFDETRVSRLVHQGLAVMGHAKNESILKDGLVTIALRFVPLLDGPTGQKLFEDTLRSADGIEDDWEKANVLNAMARSIGSMVVLN